MFDRGKEQACRRQHAGMRRHGNASDAQFARQRGRVERPATAQRQERVATGIDAAADRDEPDRFRHLGVEDAMDAERRMFEAETKRTRDRRLDRPAREVRRELQRTGREIIRIDIAQDDRCIGHRRLLAAAAVAGGTGLRARGVGPDPERAGGIDPRDRPAARPDRVHIDHRHAYRISADLAFGPDERLPAADQGDVAARPADIDGDQIVDPGRAADLQATDDTGRGARQEEPHRTLPGDGGGADAAARLHDLKRRLERRPSARSCSMLSR